MSPARKVEMSLPSISASTEDGRQQGGLYERKRVFDFGPTLAVEKLRENHACLVSRETLCKWMIEDGLWTDRKHRLPYRTFNKLQKVNQAAIVERQAAW